MLTYQSLFLITKKEVCVPGESAAVRMNRGSERCSNGVSSIILEVLNYGVNQSVVFSTKEAEFQS